MAIEVIAAEISDAKEAGEAIPMRLSIELENGQLVRIRATDCDEREYLVSLKLQGERSLCCCESPSGRVVCFLADECNCGPP